MRTDHDNRTRNETTFNYSTLKSVKFHPIPGYESRYVISRLGIVRRLEYKEVNASGRLITYKEKRVIPRLGQYNSYVVTLKDLNGKRNTKSITRLISDTYDSEMRLKDITQDSSGPYNRIDGKTFNSLTEAAATLGLYKGRYNRLF
jgi:hypothetical protein